MEHINPTKPRLIYSACMVNLSTVYSSAFSIARHNLAGMTTRWQYKRFIAAQMSWRSYVCNTI